jgi:hypothetical protein
MEKKRAMSNDRFNVFRYTMKKEDIMTFVSGLHDIQMDMIETVVIKKEREGFPEASAVIRHIMEKK